MPSSKVGNLIVLPPKKHCFGKILKATSLTEDSDKLSEEEKINKKIK